MNTAPITKIRRRLASFTQQEKAVVLDGFVDRTAALITDDHIRSSELLAVLEGSLDEVRKTVITKFTA